jgi:hypothetical protein
MPSANECRHHARDCLELASTAVDFYVHAALTELAGDFREWRQPANRPAGDRR